MNHLLLKLFTLLPLFFLSGELGAETFKGIYGPEFTFGLPISHANVPRELSDFMTRAKNHLVYGQSNEGRFAPFNKDSRSGYISPNGWWFTYENDPGVLEVQMNPMSVEDFKKYASDIQDAIFVTAANSGLFPMEFLGGGHINISTQPFKDNPLLLRNFLADYWNHNELAMGCLSYNTNSAVPLCMQDDKYLRNMQGLFNRFDRLFEIGELSPIVLIEALIRDLDKNRTRSFDVFRGQWGRPSEARQKHTDLTLSQIKNISNGRIEIRAVRPQKSIYRWIKQIELIEARINYLAQFKHPIPLRPKVPIQYPVTGNAIRKATLTPPIDVQEALKSYYLYITESGLNWEDYKEDLWPQWQTSQEVTTFENSDWFKEKEQNLKLNCANLL